MARLLRTITTPPCLLLYTIARNGGVVGGTSLARQTTTTGWCDFPSAIRPCFTSHLASPRRTCHSGTNRTVPPEKDVSCNNPVTWLFPASTFVKMLVFAGKYSVLNTVCSITINSTHPIPDYAFEEMLHHLVRKVPSLRTCFRQHQDKLWICELHKPKIDFQVAGGDLETEISSLMNLKYNHEEGPTWCARLLPYSPTDPWTTPEFKSTFPNQYTLLLGVHHAANDGFSLYIIQSAVIKLLQDVLESVHIDDSQFGRLTDPNLTMQVEQSVREKLEEDPIALNNMLEEMSTLHKSSTPLLSEAFNDPVVTQPQIKTLRTIIDRPTMESFHNKCKAAGVSLSSGMNSVLDRSLVELVREAGVQRDLYRVTSRHTVSERRYFSENPFNELGCFLGAMSHTMVGSHRDRQEFWQYAKLSGEQYQEELKQKLVYKDRILKSMLLARDDNFSYDSYFATQPPLLYDYSLTALTGSHYQKHDTTLNNKSLKATNVTIYSNINNTGFSHQHGFIQIHDTYVHLLLYSTGRITHDVAERLNKMVLKTLKDMTQ